MKTLKKILAFMGWAFVGLFGLTVLGFFITLIVVVQRGMDDSGALSDESIESKHAVGVVELTGEIITANEFREKLRKAVKNDKLKAIVVSIDSPGGAVGASEEMFQEIRRASEKKPIVCALGNIAASGGLYASLGCQKVVVHRGTLTGSIGVIMMMPNVAGLIGDTGFKMNVIKSGRFKDTGSPFRTMEQPDRELMQQLVDTAHSQFVEAVAESRGLTVENVQQFADGRIILGSQAVALGLADEIGGIARAAKIALELAGDDGEPELVTQRKPSGVFALFEDLSESRLVQWLTSYGDLQLLYRAYP
ncbi:MAG: signal peptide peptidase SppA [Bdellovibrionales bacterium]|nr:signal peptide peptidase SppA [Bdellovibrionales bacterium]